MSDKTAIEWTEATWNPAVGCDQISPGCAHCYAKAIHDRRHTAFLAGKQLPMQYADLFEVVKVRPDRLDIPLHWRRPRRVFVNSMSDLFHERIPDSFIDQVFAVMGLAQQHTFQILTKRADRMRHYMTSRPASPTVPGEVNIATESGLGVYHVRWPLPNVWLGVSVENQHFADERIPLLLQTPAAVRFISAEPLLGPVDLTAIEYRDEDCECVWNSLSGQHEITNSNSMDAVTTADDGNPRLDWVIVGGESGPGSRPFDLAWGRSIVQQCQAAGVACFVKQIGARPQVDGHDIRLIFRDHKGGDPAEWPADLRVRAFPAGPV